MLITNDTLGNSISIQFKCQWRGRGPDCGMGALPGASGFASLQGCSDTAVTVSQVLELFKKGPITFPCTRVSAIEDIRTQPLSARPG